MPAVRRRRRPLRYPVFFAHNFSERSQYLLEKVEEASKAASIELLTAPPGTAASSPPDIVRSELLRSEGMLVLAERETAWLSNEIGMAYAYDIPIFVVADEDCSLEGITPTITSLYHVSLSDPSAVTQAAAKALRAIAHAIREARRSLPEPVPESARADVVSWHRFYLMVQDLHRHMEIDYHPTLVLGISPGGTIIADLLCRLNTSRRIGLLEADRITQLATVRYAQDYIDRLIDDHVVGLRGREARVLIVDDVLGSGQSLRGAVDAVHNAVKSLPPVAQSLVQVKTLALMVKRVGRRAVIKPDYIGVKSNCSVIRFPYGRG